MMTLKKTVRSLALLSAILPAALFVTVAPSFAADMPTTKPAMAKATPEQQELIDKVKHQPIDEPLAKYDLAIGNKDGTPNDHFGKLEKHFETKHEEFIKRGKSGPIGVLFLGDSITEGWGKAPEVWKEHYGKLDPANFGIGGDRTEHVLWRMDNGELDGISPKVVVLMIGTNNTGGSDAPAILKADTKIVQELHEKLPNTKVLVLGIFPRGSDPTQAPVKAVREKIKTVNEGLAKLDDGGKIRYLDIGDKFLTPDGVLTKEIMPDALHPNVKGYGIWADAMQPLLDEMLK